MNTFGFVASILLIVLRHRSWGAPFVELEQFCEGFYCVLVDFSGVKKLKNIHLRPFMLQHGLYFDNSKGFSGVKIKK